jgi:hypothetical protein
MLTKATVSILHHSAILGTSIFIFIASFVFSMTNCGVFTSVADPDPNPDPPDPHVFGPPGSGSTSQRYGSGSFYHHAKIVRKTLIPIIF